MSGIEDGQRNTVTASTISGCHCRGGRGYCSCEPAGPRIFEKYPSKQSLGLGVSHMLCGCLFTIANGIGIQVEAWGALIGYGFVAGVLFMCTGCLGIVCGGQKTKCKIVTFMVLSIVSAGITTITVSIAIAGWENDFYYARWCKTLADNCQREDYVKVAASGTMVFLSVLEAVVAIWSSAICCDTIGCGRKNTQRNAVALQYVAASTCSCAADSVLLNPKPVYSAPAEKHDQAYLTHAEDHDILRERPPGYGSDPKTRYYSSSCSERPFFKKNEKP